MTQRKPAGVSFETWIDAQIREAMERGEFDNLPGKGKPIKSLNEPYDEMWWVKQMLVREDLAYAPPAIAIRREVEVTLALVAKATSETTVRQLLEGINERIREVNRKPMDGPPTTVMPFDVEREITKWRDKQRS